MDIEIHKHQTHSHNSREKKQIFILTRLFTIFDVYMQRVFFFWMRFFPSVCHDIYGRLASAGNCLSDWELHNILIYLMYQHEVSSNEHRLIVYRKYGL